MAVHYRTQGIIFKKNDRFESDRMFSIFTKDYGRLEIFAKAIRKINSKLRGNIDIFSLSEIEFIQGKSHKTLTDAVLLKRFKDIKDDPEKLKTANKIADILDNLIKGQEKDEHIWSLLAEVLEKLDNYNSEAIYYYFLWNFLSVLGYAPDLYKCTACQKKLIPNGLYFSNKEGGFICEKCRDLDKNSREINQDIIKILRIIFKKDWETLLKLKVGKELLNLLKEISDSYYLYFLSNFSV